MINSPETTESGSFLLKDQSIFNAQSSSVSFCGDAGRLTTQYSVSVS